MTERNKKLDEIAEQLDENILAVKGTLELIDTSVTEDDLHQLLLKAIDRMDAIRENIRRNACCLKKLLRQIG